MALHDRDDRCNIVNRFTYPGYLGKVSYKEFFDRESEKRVKRLFFPYCNKIFLSSENNHSISNGGFFHTDIIQRYFGKKVETITVLDNINSPHFINNIYLPIRCNRRSYKTSCFPKLCVIKLLPGERIKAD